MLNLKQSFKEQGGDGDPKEKKNISEVTKINHRDKQQCILYDYDCAIEWAAIYGKQNPIYL